MKKLFTLMAVALFAVCASAKTTLSATWSSWGSGCTVDGNTITFTSAWAGAGYWVSADASTSDKLVIVLAEEAVGKTKIFFQCQPETGTDLVNSGEYFITAGSKILGIDLQSDAAKDRLSAFQQICAQSTEAECKIVVKEIYLGTNEEYENDLAGNKQQNSSLSLADLGSGWGDSTYDKATQTITIGSDWSGKGWWLNPADYSDFDQLVIKFDPATEANGKIAIEYNGAETTEYEFAEGTKLAIVDLDAAGKASVKQIYIQGPAGAKYVLAAAYVATKEYVAENEDASDIPAAPTTLIDYPTKNDGITLGSSNCTYANVTIHNNNDDAIPGIKFGSSYKTEGVVNANKVELSVEGGFKSGDVITIAGAFNNSDNTKKAAVDLFTLSGTTATVLFTTNQFINGKDKEADPVEQTYTLTADADKLYLGRNGNTATYVTLLKITRGGATGIQEIPVKVINNGAIYNLAGQKVNENYKGIVIKNGKKYIQK